MGIIIHAEYLDKSLAHGKLLAIGSYFCVNYSVTIPSASLRSEKDQS